MSKISLDTFFLNVYNGRMLQTPAEAPTVNNTDGNNNTNNNNVVNKEAPKVIAPIRLPGILSRGTNEAPIPEEPVTDNVIEEDGKVSTPETKSTTETESENDNVDENDSDEDKETVDEENDTENSKPVKVLGKTFKDLAAAEVYVNKQLAIARGAQSATAKVTNELKTRLQALEEAIANNNGNKKLDTTLTADPEVEQFWNDVRATEAYIEGVKDPAEKVRLRTILTASMVQHEVQKVEDRLNKTLAERVSPFENERKAEVEKNETLSKAKAAFATVAELVDDVNNLPAYPEMKNAEDLGEIVTMWNQFKESGQIGDKILYHPDFVMTLIHSYRDLKRSKAGTAKTTNVDTKVPPASTKKKAPSTHNLPPNLQKGNGGLNFSIPGVIGRR